MGNECAESCSCESAQGNQGDCGKCECPCGNASCPGDTMSCAVGMWTGSFFQAMREAQVELLKARMQKAWGPKMEKAADAVLEAMGAHWQSMLAQEQAKSQLRERLAALWKESRG